MCVWLCILLYIRIKYQCFAMVNMHPIWYCLLCIHTLYHTIRFDLRIFFHSALIYSPLSFFSSLFFFASSLHICRLKFEIEGKSLKIRLKYIFKNMSRVDSAVHMHSTHIWESFVEIKCHTKYKVTKYLCVHRFYYWFYEWKLYMCTFVLNVFFVILRVAVNFWY